MQILWEENTDQEEMNNGKNNRRIVQNALEFAGDTQLFIEHDTEEQMNERVGNYDIVTETRRLTIQWSKVELLRKGTDKQKYDLPPPFNEIKHKSVGTILGKDINMNGSIKNAVTRRMEKAQHTWKQVNYKLLRNKAITPKIKLTLWNSLIRSAMIYGLHTTEIPASQMGRMESFMYKNIRAMMNPGWREEKCYPGKKTDV